MQQRLILLGIVARAPLVGAHSVQPARVVHVAEVVAGGYLPVTAPHHVQENVIVKLHIVRQCLPQKGAQKLTLLQFMLQRKCKRGKLMCGTSLNAEPEIMSRP